MSQRAGMVTRLFWRSVNRFGWFCWWCLERSEDVLIGNAALSAYRAARESGYEVDACSRASEVIGSRERQLFLALGDDHIAIKIGGMSAQMRRIAAQRSLVASVVAADADYALIGELPCACVVAVDLQPTEMTFVEYKSRGYTVKKVTRDEALRLLYASNCQHSQEWIAASGPVASLKCNSNNESHDSIPQCLDTQEFRVAWGEWHEHRREIRKPMTPTSTNLQLTALAAIGHDRAVAAINHSIGRGYTDVHEPSTQPSRHHGDDSRGNEKSGS